MQVASRPRLNAGIALVGASVIVVCPLAPKMPDVHLPSVQSAAVELASAVSAIASPVVSPIDQWTQVVQAAVANAQALLTTFKANPTPILSQVAHNQAITIQNLMTALQTTGGAIGTALTTTVPPLLQAAFNDLASGNVESAINNVLSATLATVFPITGFIPAVSAAFTQPLTNLVAAINAVQVGGVTSPFGEAVIGLLGPVLSGAGAFGVSVDNVGNAVAAGDPQAVLNAVVNGPATILDGVLNGGYGPNLSSLAGLTGITALAGGLLSGGLEFTSFSPLTVQLPGTINSLEALAAAFAKALTAPKVTATATTTADVKSLSTSPAALPAAASTLALTTAPATKAIAAPATDVSKLVGLPKLHVPVTAPRTVPAGTTGTGAAVTDATATATGAAVPVSGGSTSGKPTIANNPVRAAISNVSAGITKAVSGGTAKSGASAGSSKGSGGGGRHRK
jgi:hypothetical protein